MRISLVLQTVPLAALLAASACAEPQASEPQASEPEGSCPPYAGGAGPDASPFGFHPAGVSAPGYASSGFGDAQQIGVRWHRPPLYAFWFLVEPELGDRGYDWRQLDQQFGAVPRWFRVLANIAPDDPRSPRRRTLLRSYVPVDVKKHAAFVRATVERYDGDGIADMPGLASPIRHWQVGNEPVAELSGFADLQRITCRAVKEACADCVVVIAGAAGFPRDYVRQFDAIYGPILAGLGGRSVDVFDFHWYGTAGGDYRLRDAATGEDVYEHIRGVLAAHGFPADLPIWITEMGSYSGGPWEPASRSRLSVSTPPAFSGATSIPLPGA